LKEQGINDKERRIRAEQPRKGEYRLLLRLAGGVPLATIDHPDAIAGEVRGKQTGVARMQSYEPVVVIANLGI
jgi:hypothetical protein